MVREDDFSLITVSSDEDDDVVIQAGVPSTPGSAGEVSPGPASAGEVSPEPTSAAEVSPDEIKRPASNMMLTTEEDLKAPMPFAGMQRVIMAVFLLLIVAAVVYWFFIRPLGV